MKKFWKLTLAVLVAVSALASIGGIAWYHVDRRGMLSGLCEIGLPNFSRPSVVREIDLGCAVLGPKVKVMGVLRCGFEQSSLNSKSLGPVPAGSESPVTTYVINQTSPNSDYIDWSVDKPIPGVCGHMVSIEVEGWATETPGNFGHMGMYGRIFFEDRVLSVGPPPPAMVERAREIFTDDGKSLCPDGYSTSDGP